MDARYVVNKGRNEWLAVNREDYANIESIMQKLYEHDVGFYDMDGTLAKAPTIETVITDMARNRFRPICNTLSWLAKGSLRILKQGNSAYSSVFRDLWGKLSDERKQKIKKYSEEHPLKCFSGVKEYFEIDGFQNKDNILLTQAPEEIAARIKGYPLDIRSRLKDKYTEVESLIEDYHDKHNKIPSAVIFGDSHHDKDVKNRLEELLGKEAVVSVKIGKKKDIDPEFTLNMGPNWNPLIRLLSLYIDSPSEKSYPQDIKKENTA